MFNRRQLRIKVMQAVYAFLQSGSDELPKGERDLMHQTHKVFDLFMMQLSLLVEVNEMAQQMAEDGKLKHRPTGEEINPSQKFIENKFIRQIANNNFYRAGIEQRKINWSQDQETIRKIFMTFKGSDEYVKYMESPSSTYAEDKAIALELFKLHLTANPVILAMYEEKSIYWTDDIDIVNVWVIKIIKEFKASYDETAPLYRLLPGQNSWDSLVDDDEDFVKLLYRKTIINNQKYEEKIAEKVQNWELDRIAMVDFILMKMAVCELLECPTIPVKVTLNEYIEISKMYCSPNSKVFINGILDKLVDSMILSNQIKKTGRGLMEG